MGDIRMRNCQSSKDGECQDRQHVWGRLFQGIERFVARLRIIYLGIFYFLIYSLTSCYRHIIFESNAWDLGIFSQAVYQYSRFEMGFNTIRGVPNLLGDHFHPILMAFAPLYWIWSDPVMLLLAQAFLVVAAVYPIHRVARKKLQDDFAANAIAVSYLSFWGLFRAVNFDFHPIIAFLPLLAFAYYFLEEDRLLPLMLAVLLMLLVEEDMVLTVFAFGIYILTRRKFFIGTSICLISLAWFFIVTRVFIPSIGTSDFAYWQHYAYIAPDMWSAVLRLIRNPLLFIKYMFTPWGKLLTIAALLLPFAFLPLLGAFSIVAIPYLVQRFLSDHPFHWSIYFHYNALFGVIFSIAAIEALSYLKRRQAGNGKGLLGRIPVRKTAALIMAISLVIFAFLLVGFVSSFNPAKTVGRACTGYRVLREIPGDAFIVAQQSIVPHLSTSDNIYIYVDEPPEEGLSYTNLELFPFSRKHRLLENAEYIILNPELDTFPTRSDQVPRRIEELKSDPRYVTHEFDHGWIYFEKVSGEGSSDPVTSPDPITSPL